VCLSQLTPRKREQSHPIFGRCLLWPNGWMDQDASTAVKLGPSNVVLDGVTAPSTKRRTAPAPVFGPCLLWPNSWMEIKMPLGTEENLDQGDVVLDGDPVPPRKGRSSPPLFGPCLLWPRSPISATAELLLFYAVK